MSKFIVTGVAGFIGSRTAQLLCDEGHEVIGIDCFLDLLYPNEPKQLRIQKLNQNQNFAFHEIDLTTDRFDHLLQKAEAVLHFAALAGLAPSFEHPAAYSHHNVSATEKLLAALSKTNAHLVHASTSSVYGKTAIGDETLPLKPVSPYGETKLQAEALTGEYGSVSILRYFSVYGPGQRPEMAYAKAIDAALNNKEFRIFGDGTQRRTNTFIDDAARAAVLAAKAKTKEVFNISGAESISLNEALDLIETNLGTKLNRVYLPEAKGDQKVTSGDASKAQLLLNWKSEVSFRTGITKQIESQRDHAS